MRDPQYNDASQLNRFTDLLASKLLLPGDVEEQLTVATTFSLEAMSDIRMTSYIPTIMQLCEVDPMLRNFSLESFHPQGSKNISAADALSFLSTSRKWTPRPGVART